VSVSQPLLGFPSQSLNVPVHTGTQAPFTQLVPPLEFVQTLPHAPQLALLVLRFVSHPLAAFPSQLP
jgi:hypothetical protein